MRQVCFSIFFIAGILFHLNLQAQQKDSVPVVRKDTIPAVKKDTVAALVSDSTLEKGDAIYTGKNAPVTNRDSIDVAQRKRYHRATLYSTILPGAGQVYNKKYWKLPLVFAAVGIPAYFYFDNKKIYNEAQYALVVTINGSTGDSLAKVKPYLLPFVNSGSTNDLINLRDEARKNQDYAVLFFLLFYGLNIVDATVDAHLKDFNVSSDLSFKIKPMIVPGPMPSAGITLAFNIHKPRFRTLSMN